MSAANAVLDILNETPVLKDLSVRGQRLKEGMDKILNKQTSSSDVWPPKYSRFLNYRK